MATFTPERGTTNMRKFLGYCMYALFVFLLFLIEFSILHQKMPLIVDLLLSILVTFILYLGNRGITAAKQKKQEKKRSHQPNKM
jgi:threonine/homoserine/homoserine lactone efflux protein